MAQRNKHATSDVDLPKWGPSTVRSAPVQSHRRAASSQTPNAARKQRNSEQKQRARANSVARKNFLTMDKKQLAKECKKQKVLATGAKGEMVERLMAQIQKVALPKTKSVKSAKTWKSGDHSGLPKSEPKMRHAKSNTVSIADCGLKVRSPTTGSKKSMSTKKKKKKPRQSSTLKKQESQRYDQGNMFRIPGMSALDIFMNEAAANTEARKLKSGNDSVDSGSGSENRDDEHSTAQPRMKHAKSTTPMSNKTKKKKGPKVSKSVKRQSVAVTSSSKWSKKKKSTKSTTSKKSNMPTGQPKFKHANTATMARKGKGKDKNSKARKRAASGSWKSEHHSKSKSSTLKDPRSQMKKVVSRRYDESIGLKAKGMSTLNMLWADIDAKKAKETETEQKKEEKEEEEDEPHLVHANTIGANMRLTDDANEAKNAFVIFSEEDYTTDEDFDDEEMPSAMSEINAAMSEQLLNMSYTEDEIVKAVSKVANKNEINDFVEQIEKMRQLQSDDTMATSPLNLSSVSPVYRRPKDDTSPSPSPSVSIR